MRDIVYKDDYVGFTYAGIHSSQLGIKSVTSGKRYKKYLSPTSKDNTATIPGRDGTVYFGNNKSKLQFDFNIAFDDITEEEYKESLEDMKNFKFGVSGKAFYFGTKEAVKACN